MQDVWSLLNSGVVILILSGITGYLKAYIDKHNKSNEEKEKLFNELIQNNQRLFEENEENIRRDKNLAKEIKELSLIIQHTTNAGKVLFRDRIIQSCRSFIEKGGITQVARNNITEMYHWYHDELHGNGLGELYYQKMLKLPVIDEDIPIVSQLKLDEDVFHNKHLISNEEEHK